ncbi:PSP1 domain-containing protein [Paenibacillus ginsengarvi]|uniref:Stage 0 sporulation protein n=1 Tax=Paenibacillus ginsengarvi TaxID=400777 RepID=A0A3B0CKH2_9BACL|nr:stage 0 sporulation family protein [Paenibacillus ginsengarvi]RKN85208.1 stage 0 sporulation protein [Paenibacillus ginsengarvi]
MLCIVGVRFKRAGKIFYFDPGDMQVEKDQYVIVDTARGPEYGQIAIGRKFVQEADVVQPLKPVIRFASSADQEAVTRNEEDARVAFAKNVDKFKALKMKLVDAEWTFDRSKLFFYYTADNRIDFRELVKVLVGMYRTRVELRHIGVRDEARMIGGIGPCGRVLCCSSFLGELEPVSIKMAKDQRLSLNPAKISGLCGKLMCCLRFEHDNYERSNEALPKIGALIQTAYGQAKVIAVNEASNVIHVKVPDHDKPKQLELDDPSLNW